MTIIVDRNNYQQTGKNTDIMDLKNLKVNSQVLDVKPLRLMDMI